MKNFLHTHRVAIFLTIFVGCVTGLPSILAPMAIGSAYHGIPFLPLNDEYFYTARIHEVLDGHIWANSPFLLEYKNLVAPTFPTNEWFYAVPALFFGLVPVAIASKFVLSELLFLLCYFFFLSVFKRNDTSAIWSAIAGSLVIVLGAEFVNYSYDFGILDGSKYPIENLWTRMVNPVMGGVQLFTFLLLISKIWNRGWHHAYLAAAVVLATMVGYFFSFGLALSTLGTLFLIALARKEFDVARALFIVGAISVLLDAGWWYHMLFSMGGKEGIALAMKNGLFFTHTPVLNKALLTATVISSAFFGFAHFYLQQREHVREYLFASALLSGCWIAFNEQVITGREVWYPHFMQYTVPLGVAAIIITGYFAFRHLKHLWVVCVATLCSICIVYGLYAVTAYTAPWDLDRLIQLQSAATYATWLDENTPKDCVVLANPNDTDLYDEERLIPTFSHCNTYTVDFVPFGITSERVEHNYLLQLRMRDIGANDIRTYLMGQEGWIRGLFPSDWHQTFGHGMEPWVLDRIGSLSKDYQSFVKVPLETQIKKYRVDYVLSEAVLSQKLLTQMPDLKMIASPGGYHIYSFRKDME